MAWPPIYTPEVPQAIDQPFPAEWSPAPPQPYSVDAQGSTWPPQPVQAQPQGTPWSPVVQEQPVEPEQWSPVPEQEQPPEQLATPVPWAQWAQQKRDLQAIPEREQAQKAEAKRADEQLRQQDPEQWAIKKRYELESQAAEKQAQGELQAARSYREQLADDKAQAEKESQIAAAAEAKVSQAWEDVSKAKVDPDNFWSSRSTGQKVAGFIGAAIGGFLAARQGGRNQFMDQMNQLIANDIQAQEANLANMRAGAQGQQGVYAQMLDRFGDARTARAMTAASMYDAAMRDTAAQTAQFKSPITQAQGAQAVAQLAAQRDASMGAARQAQFENGLKAADVQLKAEKQAEEARQNRAQVGLGYANISAQERARDAEMKERAAERQAAANAKLAAMSKEERERVILGPNGKPVVSPDGTMAMAPDAKVAFTERQKQAAGQSYYEELDRYAKYTEKIGREYGGFANISSSSEELSRAESMHKSLLMKYKTAESLGALDKGAIEVWNSVVQPPSTWTNASNPAVSAQEARRVYRDTKNMEMRQVYGYSGNWVDDYEASLPKKVGATSAKGNRQGGTVTPVYHMSDEGEINTEGRGRPLNDAEVQAEEIRRERSKEYVPEFVRRSRQSSGRE